MRKALLIFLSLALAFVGWNMVCAEDFYVIPVIKGKYAPVPKTGQTLSYATGDDGDLEKGVAWPTPRFTDNGNGTVTDNLTGLIWTKNANMFYENRRDIIWPPDPACDACNRLNSGEHGLTDGSVEGDWRLPNLRELHSLIHYGFVGPALPNTLGTGQWTQGDPFTDVQSYYWSSTTYAGNQSYGWLVQLSDGNVHNEDKEASHHVWCVRGGK